MNYKDMQKKAEKVKAIEDLTPTYFEFEKKGDEIVGRYKGRSPVKSSLGEGEYHQYLFETDDGLIKFAMGQSTDKEAGALMGVNGVYVVTFQGKQKISGGRSVNKFTIHKIDEAAVVGEEEGEEAPF